VKIDICAEVNLWNEHVDGLIYILRLICTAGVLPRQVASCHEERLETLRTKLNSDLRKLIALCERLDLDSTRA
jgi:hypothetical protein